MSHHSRLSPALPADMIDADREQLAPILEHFRRQLSVARFHAPFGVLLALDQQGPARRTARAFDCAPTEVIRLHKQFPEARH